MFFFFFLTHASADGPSGCFYLTATVSSAATSPTLDMLSLLSPSRVLCFQPFQSFSPCFLPSLSRSLPPLSTRVRRSPLNTSSSNKQRCSESLLLPLYVRLLFLLFSLILFIMAT